MLVSVIIPTRGRDLCLRRTLESFAIQTFQDFEIWVVDQNDSAIANLKAHTGKAVLHHVSMPPQGSHAGRNLAIFQTKSTFCIFVDDDVVVPPQFIQLHIHALTCQSNFSVIAGRVLQPKDGFTEEQLKRLGKKARYNHWFGMISGNFIGNKSGEVQHLHECNFSARTEALKAVGGFNEEFLGNAYFEGADLGLRLIKAGYRIFYEPSISLTHFQESSGGNRENNKSTHTYWYMRNYALLNSLHMNKLGLPFFGMYALAYVFGKSLKNTDLKIAKKGIEGIFDGLHYFAPRSSRLKTRI